MTSSIGEDASKRAAPVEDWLSPVTFLLTEIDAGSQCSASPHRKHQVYSRKHRQTCLQFLKKRKLLGYCVIASLLVRELVSQCLRAS
ncbi:hypothetical protein RRG08_022621 [Elysia crispata]|uniref:Uncharacterized protein n=1 Tax=Elysia crispata TaxID=231223 RepID=A0AAE1D8H5_9GAST|nr:hypothetical protein RRG08_022621 [Elysia crispata]